MESFIMGLNLGFRVEDSLFPRARDTGQGIGTKQMAQFLEEFNLQENLVLFISPDDFETSALCSRTIVGYHNALNFDGAAQENAQGAHFILPASWIDKQLKFTIWWTSQVAGAGNCYWKLYLQWNESVERLITDHSLNSGANLIDTKTSDSFVQAISWQTSTSVFKKDAFVGMRIYRFGNDGLDTLAVEADLLGITVEVVQ